MSYDHNAHVSIKNREKTASVQDIQNSKYWKLVVDGPANIERRLKGANSLKFFCETYGSEQFTLDWSKAHLQAIELLEDSVLRNKRFCLSFPRGSGKSTLCGWTLLWAMLNSHSAYSVSIGATAKSANKDSTILSRLLDLILCLVLIFPKYSPLFYSWEVRAAVRKGKNAEALLQISYGARTRSGLRLLLVLISLGLVPTELIRPSEVSLIPPPSMEKFVGRRLKDQTVVCKGRRLLSLMISKLGSLLGTRKR